MFRKIWIVIMLVWIALLATGCGISEVADTYEDEQPIYDYERWDRI